eukprot:3143764-Rhodomonas_salina.1
MRPDRGAPIDLIEAAKDLKEQGDYVFMQCEAESLLLVAWKDSSTVYSISNGHPNATTFVERRKKGCAAKESIQSPIQLAEYNRSMGAIDDFDQLLAFMSARLKSRKWWHSIFYFIVDAASINGWFLWKWDHSGKEWEYFTRRDWGAQDLRNNANGS